MAVHWILPVLRSRLDDAMLDLDLPVTILGPDGSELFSGVVERPKAVIEQTLNERGDRELIFTTEIEVVL